MSERRVTLAIIGAGPAGLAAAQSAASQGVDTLLLDAHAEPGGHFYSLPPDHFGVPEADEEALEGRRLADAARRAGADLWHGVEVWGIYREQPWLLCLSGAPVATLRADAVIVAAGAEERALPFPGWTLPGVMTAGAAQRLLKNQRLRPGRRVLLSGSGPLQLAVAAGLVSAGVEVVGVLEARSPGSLARGWRYLPLLLGLRTRQDEAKRYLGALWSARVPLRLGWTVSRAAGQGGVEAAEICRLDGQGHPLPGARQTLAVDTICLGYGLVPASALWRQVPIHMVFDPWQQCHLPVRDPWGQTSQPGFYVVGDAAGISGHEAAQIEGQLAGLAVAAERGLLSDAQRRDKASPLQGRLKQERRFGHLLADLFGPLPGLLDLAADDTVICRCEHVTLGQVRQAVAGGVVSVEGVRHSCRAGMGWCQGRTCASSVANIIAAETGLDLAAAGRQTPRPPAFPVPLAELLQEDAHD